jgi:hypothetical protein
MYLLTHILINKISLISYTTVKMANNDAFKCKICTSIMRPPVVLGKRCRSLLGCETCIGTWYDSGIEGLMRNCPNCSTPRGYDETMRVAGLDELLNSIRPLYEVQETN